MGKGFGEVRREFVDRSASAVNRYAGKVDTAVGTVGKAATAVNGLSSFQGAAAEAVKAYWSEAQTLVASALGVAAQQLAMQVTLYASGYDSVDANGGAWFNEGTLDDTAAWAKGAISTAADDPVSRYMQVVNDPDVQKLVSEKAYGIKSLSSGSIDRMVQGLGTKASDLCTAVQSYEDTEAGKVPSVSDLVDSATQAMTSLGSYASGKAYTPGQVYNEAWYGPLAVEMLAANSWQKKNAAAYKKALKGFNTRVNQRVAIRANARKQRGESEMLKSSVNAFAGVFAFVGDIKNENPISAIVSGAYETFQVSDFLEGFSDWALGSSGKEGHSFNLLRDTAFVGNQKAYDFAKTTSGYVSGVAGVADKFFKSSDVLGLADLARAEGWKVVVEPGGKAVVHLGAGIVIEESGIYISKKAAAALGKKVQDATGSEALGNLTTYVAGKVGGKLSGKASGKAVSGKSDGKSSGSANKGPNIQDPQGSSNEHFNSSDSSTKKPGQTPPKGHATPKQPKPPVSSSPHPKTNDEKKKAAKKRKMKKNSQQKNKKK